MSAIAIFLSARLGSNDAIRTLAASVGTTLANAGITVVYGGASVGLMGILADAALVAGGQVVGVIPHSMVGRELAHTGLSELIVVETMAERKDVMAARSDGFLVLPGGFGTLDEMFEMLTTEQIGGHTKRTVVLDNLGYYDGLWAWMQRATQEGLLAAEHGSMAHRVPTIEAALAALGVTR